MIRKWENRYQRMQAQNAGHPKAQKGTTAEGESSRILTANCPLIVQDFPHRKEDLCPASPLGVWTAFYKSDSRIALGKYSPMEKEILRLGGIHTIAARRFLADKHNKEREMLRELQSQSPDYKKATNYKRQLCFPCAVYGPPEKIWTAKVAVPAEEFKMPQREMVDINKHVERMKLARALRNKQFCPYIERCRGAQLLSRADRSPTDTDKVCEKEDEDASDKLGKASQEDQKEHERTKAQEIIMNVAFKSEEPKKGLICHRNDRKAFLPQKKERSITGLTNRNLFPIADFPGDLMLMQQDFISRGIHPNDAIQTYWLQEEDACKEQSHRASHSLY